MKKGDKDMALKEPMVQLMPNDEQQKEQIRQHKEKMQLILQHINIKSLMVGPILH